MEYLGSGTSSACRHGRGSVWKRGRWSWPAGIALAAILCIGSSPAAALGPPVTVLTGRIVAVGIPGVGAISPVGTFLAGGPIPTKFPGSILPGAILDPTRILVASQSNLGEPVKPPKPPGSILSLDPSGASPLIIPPDFASGGGQASTAGGRIQLYTANNSAFVNDPTPLDAGAPTANWPGVSVPLGISINNAFGRLWFANAPYGFNGLGMETVLDPNGAPLANPPSTQAGGVFADSLNSRVPAQKIPGAIAAGVGNALLGMSPDNQKAIFAVVGADGNLTQVQTLAGVDGLTTTPVISPLGDPAPGQDLPRVGVAWNGIASILFVTDRVANRIVKLQLVEHNDPLDPIYPVFSVGSATPLPIPPGVLHTPMDLAATLPEVSHPEYASNTSLTPTSDLYVLNHDDNTIVRITQDGTVIGIGQVVVPPLAGGHLNGIAVSRDHTRIWVTFSGTVPGFAPLQGAVIELPMF